MDVWAGKEGNRRKTHFLISKNVLISGHSNIGFAPISALCCIILKKKWTNWRTTTIWPTFMMWVFPVPYPEVCEHCSFYVWNIHSCLWSDEDVDYCSPCTTQRGAPNRGMIERIPYYSGGGKSTCWEPLRNSSPQPQTYSLIKDWYYHAGIKSNRPRHSSKK